ncbi:MAG: LysR family transcriptional regulator [Archangium sp.]|nr:LysR family transcriptional regulator [Archangium sp.]MDP3154535.1 LysR family transcriptional regulator [Archangium sp.]MDP3569426.1 LysR family transcriptional regulator [Archangium sp.]
MHEALNWDDLRFFLAAAQHGGFGAAARKLDQQQSTVSRRVAALESKLGAAVFDRTAAGLTLTGLGRRVLNEAQVMEAALHRVAHAASATEKGVEGVVRVAMTETLASVFVIPQVLPGLLAAHPKLRLDLVIGNTSADLARREADIAVRFFLMPSGDLMTRRVARLETAVVGSRALVKKLSKLKPAQWPFVAAWLPGGEVPEEAWREAFGRGEVRVTTNSFHAQVEAVRAGLGVAVLPVALCEPLTLSVLSLPQGTPPPPPLDTYLVTPRALRRVPRVAAVFDALATALSSLCPV